MRFYLWTEATNSAQKRSTFNRRVLPGNFVHLRATRSSYGRKLSPGRVIARLLRGASAFDEDSVELSGWVGFVTQEDYEKLKDNIFNKK